VLRQRPAARLAAALLALLALAVTACEPRTTNPPTTPGTKRIVLYGDSMPSWLLGKGSSRGLDKTKFTVLDGSVSACDGDSPFRDARWVDNKIVPVVPFCKLGWRKHYPPYLATRPDAAVIMGGTHAMLDHMMNGVWVHPCSATGRKAYYDDIKARLNYLNSYADEVFVVLPAWPGPKSRWIMPADYIARADCVREELQRAATIRRAHVIDFGTYLCPTSKTVCKDYRSGNSIHVDDTKAPTVLKWLLTSVAAELPS
jgi:hypothetical protein